MAGHGQKYGDEAGLTDIWNLMEEDSEKEREFMFKMEYQNDQIIKLLQEIKATLEKPKD